MAPTFVLFRPEVISSTPLLVAAAAVVAFFLVDMAGLSSVAASLASLSLYSLSLSVVDAAAKAVRAASLVSFWEWVHAKNTKQTYQL